MSLLFRPINTVVMTFFVKTLFQRKTSSFLTFSYPFLMFFLCTTIETVTSMISCQTIFHIIFFLIFHLLSCLFCINLLVRSSRFYLRTVCQRTRNFLTSNFRFAVSFLCTTIETIFRIVLCPNDILKELFF